MVSKSPVTRLEKIQVATQETLRQYEGGGLPYDPVKYPLYGYFEIDRFNCSPFIMFTNNDCASTAGFVGGWSYEEMSLALWANLSAIATSVFDIGAYVGLYSLVAASVRQDNITIHAFEPHPEAYNRLEINVAANGFNSIKHRQLALGNKDGMVRFQWGDKATKRISPSGQIFFGESLPGTHTTIVPMSSLDSLFGGLNFGKRPLIKIDVETAEGLVFDGMKTVLPHRPDIILETFHEGVCDEITQITLPFGYRYYLIDDEDNTLVRQDRLLPRPLSSMSYNQLLTARPEQDIAALAEIV